MCPVLTPGAVVTYGQRVYSSSSGFLYATKSATWMSKRGGENALKWNSSQSSSSSVKDYKAACGRNRSFPKIRECTDLNKRLDEEKSLRKARIQGRQYGPAQQTGKRLRDEISELKGKINELTRKVGTKQATNEDVKNNIQNDAKDRELAKLAKKRQQLMQRRDALKNQIETDQFLIKLYRRRREEVELLQELIKDRRRVP
ncbi:unnamed protein product [Gongylonema pulchrum]|uniref:NAM-associated domain-containing protein n=1 Tax=Gongylonema pulchrum TaxID=637853 RepID=A0A183DUI4_9BILA|nr:unnamed protein product [Gongylonema pulchrum]